jgi:peptidoglycan hydrolase CwlO-like protein
MKKVQILLVVLLLLSVTWAMYERSERTKLVDRVEKLEADFLKSSKDCEFLTDKAKSLEEKLKNLLNEKEELSKALKAKDEFISSLQDKLNKAQQTISELQAKLKNLESLISTLQGGTQNPPSSQ